MNAYRYRQRETAHKPGQLAHSKYSRLVLVTLSQFNRVIANNSLQRTQKSVVGTDALLIES